MPRVRAAAPADHGRTREQGSQGTQREAVSSTGSPSSRSVAELNSSWLRADALARSPTIGDRHAPGDLIALLPGQQRAWAAHSQLVPVTLVGATAELVLNWTEGRLSASRRQLVNYLTALYSLSA